MNYRYMREAIEKLAEEKNREPIIRLPDPLKAMAYPMMAGKAMSYMRMPLHMLIGGVEEMKHHGVRPIIEKRLELTFGDKLKELQKHPEYADAVEEAVRRNVQHNVPRVQPRENASLPPDLEYLGPAIKELTGIQAKKMLENEREAFDPRELAGRSTKTVRALPEFFLQHLKEQQ